MKKNIERFDSQKFIEIVLIRDIKSLIDKGFDYFSFVALAQGIEVLGSFFDRKGFDTPGRSKKRFVKGLKKLFPINYSRRGVFLYKNLRCGLAHLLQPKKGISLSSYQSNSTKEMHLTRKNGKTLLVADAFYEDFKVACDTLIAKLNSPKNREIPKKKKKAILIEITENTIETEIYTDTGKTYKTE